MRLDLWLVQAGHAPTRSRAQDYIATGKVSVGGMPVLKASYTVAEGDEVSVNKPDIEWVSRAAYKLVHGLETFNFSAKDCVALDIGASTGGFTQVLLARGASKVYAVDVGHGQLHSSLHGQPSIVLLEHTNARTLDAQQIPETPHSIVCDASFISLKLALPAALQLAGKGAWLVALIKPQFEVGKSQVGKGGIVKDEALHKVVCEDITNWLEAADWRVKGVVDSPIAGQDGNREFLIGATYHG